MSYKDPIKTNNIFKFWKHENYFFWRKSQHFVLGGWWEHQGDFTKLKYSLRYPKAWIKYMYWRTLDFINPSQ